MSRRSPLDHRRGELTAGGAVVVGSLLGVVVASPVAIVGPWLIAAGIVHHRHHRARRRRRQALDEALPLFVDALMQRLKAGGSLAQALRATIGAPAVESRLVALRTGLRAGLGLDRALARQRSAPVEDGSVAGPSLDLVVTTLAVLVERGGPALPSLERLNDTLRSAGWIEAEARTQAAQATASAAVLAALPAVFVIALVLLDDRLARFYAFDPVGSACLLGAATLAYGGWAWMQHLTELDS